MKKLFLIFAILLTEFSLFADDFPTSFRIQTGGKFFLQCDSNKKTTTCFEITKNGDKEKWTIQDCGSFAHISESGVFCVLEYKNVLAEKDFDKKTVLLKIYKNGKHFDTLTVGKVFDNPMFVKNQKSDSDYKLNCIEISFDDGILLHTDEEILWYDFGKKKIVNAKKKLAEISVKRRKNAFDMLGKTFANSKNLIADNADKEKLSLAVAKIQSLYKNKKLTDSPRGDFDVFEDGDQKLSLRYSNGGAFKGAFGHSVKAVFYFRDGNSYISFFLCNDDCELFIDMSGGGKRENVQGWGALDSDFQPDYEPSRYYELNSKEKTVRTGDFYWD